MIFRMDFFLHVGTAYHVERGVAILFLFQYTSAMPDEATNVEEASPEITALFEAGAHFAYKKTRRHPKMREYIAGVKSNVEIFHLDKVFELLTEAKEFVSELGMNGKTVLWVGTKPAAGRFVKKVSEELGQPSVTNRWLGGTLTNFDMIRGRVKHMESLEEKKKTGELEKYTKQERLRIDEEITKLNGTVGSLRTLHGLPDVLIVVDTNEESTAVREATRLNIPIVSIMNSDCDPSMVAKPIPASMKRQPFAVWVASLAVLCCGVVIYGCVFNA